MGIGPSKATPASLPAAAAAAGWSSLPPELVDLVLCRLFTAADRLRFATVCRHWNEVATLYSLRRLPTVLPWLNFHDGYFQSLPDGALHAFGFGSSPSVVCVGSFGRWLLFQDSGDKPSRRYFLEKPLTGSSSRTPLPGHCKAPVGLGPSNSDGSTRFFITKVIVCSSDLVVAMVKYPRHRRHDDVVVCCRPGKSSSWSAGLRNGRSYQDMAFYKGKLYAVTEEGDLFAHEVITEGAEPRVSRIERVIQAPPPLKYTLDGPYATLKCVRTCYLVVSRDQRSLLMVRWIVPCDDYPPQDSTKEMALRVFEADFKTGRWVEVKSLDDQVLFVCSNNSMSRAVYPPGHREHCDYLQGNRIYFVDDGLKFLFRLPTSSPRKCGVYDMSTGTIQSISLADTHLSDQLEGSWFFPQGHKDIHIERSTKI